YRHFCVIPSSRSFVARAGVELIHEKSTLTSQALETSLVSVSSGVARGARGDEGASSSASTDFVASSTVVHESRFPICSATSCLVSEKIVTLVSDTTISTDHHKRRADFLLFVLSFVGASCNDTLPSGHSQILPKARRFVKFDLSLTLFKSALRKDTDHVADWLMAPTCATMVFIKRSHCFATNFTARRLEAIDAKDPGLFVPNLDGGKATVSGARRQSRSLFVAAGRPYVNHVHREETSGAIPDRIAIREKPYVSNWDGDKGVLTHSAFGVAHHNRRLVVDVAVLPRCRSSTLGGVGKHLIIYNMLLIIVILIKGRVLDLADAHQDGATLVGHVGLRLAAIYLYVVTYATRLAGLVGSRLKSHAGRRALRECEGKRNRIRTHLVGLDSGFLICGKICSDARKRSFWKLRPITSSSSRP
ncbi:hypothetical protein ALC60_14752, partial [Trachymyrmex zeteki]